MPGQGKRMGRGLEEASWVDRGKIERSFQDMVWQKQDAACWRGRKRAGLLSNESKSSSYPSLLPTLLLLFPVSQSSLFRRTLCPCTSVFFSIFILAKGSRRERDPLLTSVACFFNEWGALLGIRLRVSTIHISHTFHL